MAYKPKIFICSTVHDKRELLDQIDATLSGIGYEVWISGKGTFPIDPSLSNFENCLAAVEKCDLFLGIIGGYYGSGQDGSSDSITHQELSCAIKLNKRRWFLVHEDVLVVRNFIKCLKRFEETHGIEVCSKLELRQHDPISDIRILQMYEEATKADVDLKKRTGNWVQPFRTSHDVLRFITAQFAEPSKYEPYP